MSIEFGGKGGGVKRDATQAEHDALRAQRDATRAKYDNEQARLSELDAKLATHVARDGEVDKLFDEIQADRQQLARIE